MLQKLGLHGSPAFSIPLPVLFYTLPSITVTGTWDTLGWFPPVEVIPLENRRNFSEGQEHQGVFLKQNRKCHKTTSQK